MNLKQLSIITALLLPFCISARQTLTILDAEESFPVPGATVISNSGLILGMSDNEGRLSIEDNTTFPLTIRSLGYTTMSLPSPADTIRLEPMAINLREVSVNPADRPVTRVLCYVREYASGATSSDTLQIFSEFMMEFFGAEDKVKGLSKRDSSMPRVRAARRFSRIVNANGKDSIARPRHDDDEASLSFAEFMSNVPFEVIEETQAIRDGASSDIVQGKYFPKTTYRKNKGTYSIHNNALADHEGGVWSPWFFKLVGMTMELNQCLGSTAYAVNRSNKYGIHDLLYSTYSIGCLGKGKLFRKAFHTKEPIAIDCYIEIYPVDISHCSVDEYKELKKDRSAVEFRLPAELQPMAPAVKKLVDRINSEIPGERAGL